MAAKKKATDEATDAGTSSDGRFSEHHVEIKAANGHGALSVEERGEPDKSVSPSDEG